MQSGNAYCLQILKRIYIYFLNKLQMCYLVLPGMPTDIQAAKISSSASSSPSLTGANSPQSDFSRSCFSVPSSVVKIL